MLEDEVQVFRTENAHSLEANIFRSARAQNGKLKLVVILILLSKGP